MGSNGSGVLRGMGIHKQAQWILGEGVLPFQPPEHVRHKKFCTKVMGIPLE